MIIQLNYIRIIKINYYNDNPNKILYIMIYENTFKTNPINCQYKVCCVSPTVLKIKIPREKVLNYER